MRAYICRHNAYDVTCQRTQQETHWDEGGYDDGDEVDEEEGVSGGDDNEESFIMEDSLRDPDDEVLFILHDVRVEYM